MRHLLALIFLSSFGVAQFHDHRFLIGPTIFFAHHAVGLTFGYTLPAFGIAVSIRNNFGTAQTSSDERYQIFSQDFARSLNHSQTSDAQHIWGGDVLLLYGASHDIYPYISLGFYYESIHLQFRDPLSVSDPSYISPYGNRKGYYWLREGRKSIIVAGVGLFYEMNSIIGFQMGLSSLPDLSAAVLFRF